MYQPQSFDRLLGTPGFSEVLLRNHFTLYEGYVKNVNALIEKLATLRTEGKMSSPEYAELKRRFGWEFNGMRLHELYFGNMTKDEMSTLRQAQGDNVMVSLTNHGHSDTSKSALDASLVSEFGSWDSWLADFKASGTMRGIGWVVLSCDPQQKKLFNVWVNEHDLGLLAGSTLLLVLDVFEHAYMLDYGLKKADYLEAFLKAVNWSVVSERFERAMMMKNS